tara:strand:- start:2311 stop:2700 length:390 start_codon:yes stop_codon:yes gene_type:complete
MLSENGAKARINKIHQSHLILDYYSQGILKNSVLNQQKLDTLEQKKKECIETLNSLSPEITKITKRELNFTKYNQGIETSSNLLKDHFFDSKEIIEQILLIYEKNTVPLIEQFMINPLDQMKIPKINFI